MAYGNNLYIEPLQDNGCIVSVSLCNTTSLNVNLQYSFDNSTWKDYTSGKELAIEYGSKIYFKGTNTGLSIKGTYTKFSITGGNVKLGGNVMGLLDNGVCTATSMFYAYTFACLFINCATITTVEDGLLPATTLGKYCYLGMFQGCTSLVTAPALPVTTLADYCYDSMFANCTSLVNAPALPATTLTKGCYISMFFGCTSLVNAPALPATTLADSCCWGMFRGCTSLVNAPSLPATTLANYCYYSMFYNCTSLVTAPALPATTLADDCYDSMFLGCTSLVNPPECLLAKYLHNYYYYGMFEGCTSLTKSPIIKCEDICYNFSLAYMFEGCTSLSEITFIYTGNGQGIDSFKNWVSGVASTGTFYKYKDMSESTLGRGVNGIPTGWTVMDYEEKSCELILSGSNCTLTGAGTYEVGSTVTISCTPNSGYEFESWSNGDTNATTTVTIPDSTTFTLTATLKQTQYTLTLQGDNCTLTGAGLYEPQSEATAQCTPDDGYTFSHWTREGVEITQNPYKFKMIKDISMTATVTAIPKTQYTLTLNGSNCTFTPASGSKFDAGTNVDITCNPLNGYTFVTWNDGISINPRTVNMNENKTFTATVIRKQCTLTLEGDNCTLTGGGTYNAGTSVTIKCTPDEGYIFSKWSDYNTNAERTITVNDTQTLTAYVVPQTYVTLTCTENPNCTVTGTGSKPSGSSYIINAYPKTGYQFAYWTVLGRNVTSNPYEILELGEDLTISVTVVKLRYTLSLSGSHCVVNGAGTYDYGTQVTISCEPDSGYEFLYWNDGNTSATRTITVTDNISLVAAVKQSEEPTSTITVAIEHNPACTVLGNGTYNEGSEVTLTAVPSSTYRFDKWNYTVGGITRTSTSNPLEILELGGDLTGTVSVVKQYNITLNGNHCTLVGTGTYDVYSIVTLKCIPDEGYIFTRWSDNNTNAERSFSIQRDYDLIAYVTEETPTSTHSVEIEDNPNCTVTGNGNYDEGQTVTLTCTPNTGYNFNRWYINFKYIKSNPYTFTMKKSDIIGEVELKQVRTYTVSLAGTNCTLSGGGTYSAGTTVEIVCTPNSGYDFNNWSDGNLNPRRLITVNSNINLNASVEAPERRGLYTVNVTPGSECSVVGNESGIFQGSDVVLTCIPNVGYKFNKWILNGVTYKDNPHTIKNISENVTGTASVVLDPSISYTVNVDGGSNASVIGNGTYSAGSDVTLTCNPSEGFKFSKWKINNKYYTDNPITFKSIKQDLTGVVMLMVNVINVDCPTATNGKFDMLYNNYNEGVKSIVVSNTGERYTFDNCNANYVLYYKNDFGGYDALACSGKVVKKDTLERLTIKKPFKHNNLEFGKVNYKNTITESWSLVTGYLTDYQSLRMHHLINSTEVYLHNIVDNKVIPVVITDTSNEYKTFKNNGRKKISYTINVENSQSKTRQ